MNYEDQDDKTQCEGQQLFSGLYNFRKKNILKRNVHYCKFVV